jgi:hypothetical protein
MLACASVMRRTPPFLVALVMSLVLAAPASADLFTQVVNDYIKDQRLNVCQYTQDQLKKIKDAVPVDQNAYTPEFIAAVDDAIARRAEGACNKKKVAQAITQAPAPTPGGGATPPPAAGRTPAPPAPGQPAVAQPPPTPGAEPTPAPEIATDAIPVAARTAAHAGGGGDAPFPVLALAVLAGLLTLGGLVFGLVRWRAWEPDWVQRMRHATGEAGWRAASTWAEFTDFVRFGR